MLRALLRVRLAIGLGVAVSTLCVASQADEPKPAADPALVDPLRKHAEAAIAITARRELDGRAHTPWQIIHGVLGMRDQFYVRVDGQRMSAIDWFHNQSATYANEPYFEVTEFGGRGHPFTKPMLFEGHPTQFLAYLTMTNLPLDFQVKSGDKTLTIQDLVTGSQKEVKTGEEPGWTLWALTHYLGVDATWENKDGEPWSIERLVRSQTYETVHTAACGGTHGLFALAYARDKYLETGRPLRGVWLEADQKVRRYIAEAKALQNADGSFSVDFFKGKKWGKTVEERLGPSGHMFEFLMIALPREQLDEQWARNAVYSVTRDLEETKSQTLSVAPLYHAVDGLHIWLKRTASTNAPRVPVATTSSISTPGGRPGTSPAVATGTTEASSKPSTAVDGSTLAPSAAKD